MARIQFELTDDQLKEIDKIMSECGIKTKKDLLNTSIGLLEWVIDEKRSGRFVAAIEEKENKYVFRELLLPFLKKFDACSA